MLFYGVYEHNDDRHGAYGHDDDCRDDSSYVISQ